MTWCSTTICVPWACTIRGTRLVAITPPSSSRMSSTRTVQTRAGQCHPKSRNGTRSSVNRTISLLLRGARILGGIGGGERQVMFFPSAVSSSFFLSGCLFFFFANTFVVHNHICGLLFVLLFTACQPQTSKREVGTIAIWLSSQGMLNDG